MVLRRMAAAVAVVAVVIGVSAGVAAAHVTVSPSTAAEGSFSVLTFRVPNEKSDASTVKLAVKLPTDTPFAFVSVKPVPGWTVETTTEALATPITSEGESITEAVSTVTWSGGTIEPGQFQEFSISVGPVPDVESMTFPAVQTYSDGEEVAWIQLAEAGQPEPDRPAPELTVTAAATDGDHHDAGSTATTEAGAADDSSDETAASASGSDHDDSSNALGITALVVGGVALVVSVVALVRRPKASGV